MTVDVALKEWQAVVDAVASGRQSILLRKGGVQEGPTGFTVAHGRFALMPVRLHQKPDMLKPEHRPRIDDGVVDPESFRLTHAAEVVDVHVVPSRESLDRLNDLHVWNAGYLDMRWNYRPRQPLYLIVLRALKLAEPFDLRNTFKVAGCKSWVLLPRELQVEGDAVTDADDATDRVEAALSELS